jgi:hypothetical protein
MNSVDGNGTEVLFLAHIHPSVRREKGSAMPSPAINPTNAAFAAPPSITASDNGVIAILTSGSRGFSHSEAMSILEALRAYAEHPDPAMRPDYGQFKKFTVTQALGIGVKNIQIPIAQTREGLLIVGATVLEGTGDRRITTVLTADEYGYLLRQQQADMLPAVAPPMNSGRRLFNLNTASASETGQNFNERE